MSPRHAVPRSVVRTPQGRRRSLWTREARTRVDRGTVAGGTARRAVSVRLMSAGLRHRRSLHQRWRRPRRGSVGPRSAVAPSCHRRCAQAFPCCETFDDGRPIGPHRRCAGISRDRHDEARLSLTTRWACEGTARPGVSSASERPGGSAHSLGRTPVALATGGSLAAKVTEAPMAALPRNFLRIHRPGGACFPINRG